MSEALEIRAATDEEQKLSFAKYADANEQRVVFLQIRAHLVAQLNAIENERRSILRKLRAIDILIES